MLSVKCEMVNFYLKLSKGIVSVWFSNQWMGPRGEISLAPRTIDSGWFQTVCENKTPHNSIEKKIVFLIFKNLISTQMFDLCALFCQYQFPSPIQTIKVAEMSATQIMNLLFNEKFRIVSIYKCIFVTKANIHKEFHSNDINPDIINFI